MYNLTHLWPAGCSLEFFFLMAWKNGHLTFSKIGPVFRGGVGSFYSRLRIRRLQIDRQQKGVFIWMENNRSTGLDMKGALNRYKSTGVSGEQGFCVNTSRLEAKTEGGGHPTGELLSEEWRKAYMDKQLVKSLRWLVKKESGQFQGNKQLLLYLIVHDEK